MDCLHKLWWESLSLSKMVKPTDEVNSGVSPCHLENVTKICAQWNLPFLKFWTELLKRRTVCAGAPFGKISLSLSWGTGLKISTSETLSKDKLKSVILTMISVCVGQWLIILSFQLHLSSRRDSCCVKKYVHEQLTGSLGLSAVVREKTTGAGKGRIELGIIIIFIYWSPNIHNLHKGALQILLCGFCP